jgi:anti-sigma regulatory factor (Ser/Thr protein kinase)
VEEMSASWKGLANITFNVVPQLDGADAPHDVIGQLIEEAVVNAIRHGKAKNVHIKAFAYESAFAVEVADDGASDLYTKGSGLGTILFDTFTQDWSIAREANKTVVRFSIRRS